MPPPARLTSFPDETSGFLLQQPGGGVFSHWKLPPRTEPASVLRSRAKVALGMRLPD